MDNYETAWVIESENGYFIGEVPRLGTNNDTAYLGWVSDHYAALRFARKTDAEQMMRVCRGMGIGFHDQAKGATEHVWYLR